MPRAGCGDVYLYDYLQAVFPDISDPMTTRLQVTGQWLPRDKDQSY